MLVSQAQSVPLTHVKEMKLKHWTTLGLAKADRDQITTIYANEELQMFINQTQGFTISQFKSNIRADTVQMLLKMGITLPDGVKATVMNYQGYLESILLQHPWLRHADPAKCLLKLLWFLKTDMERNPDRIAQSSGDEDA